VVIIRSPADSDGQISVTPGGSKTTAPTGEIITTFTAPGTLTIS
jgi:hypothetical protein